MLFMWRLVSWNSCKGQPGPYEKQDSSQSLVHSVLEVHGEDDDDACLVGDHPVSLDWSVLDLTAHGVRHLSFYSPYPRAPLLSFRMRRALSIGAPKKFFLKTAKSREMVLTICFICWHGQHAAYLF